jgi:geranylgeranyl pyrophosphate synthase
MSANPSHDPLAGLQPALGQRLHANLAVIENLLHAQVTQPGDPFLTKAARHLIQAGGKRLRPLLVLLGADLQSDGQRQDMVNLAAVVVELVHVGSLYHDDVMDASPQRRGTPSAHTLWGDRIALLAGSYILARAAELSTGLCPCCTPCTTAVPAHAGSP